METMNGEIEKTASFVKTDYVTRADIDTVVTPVLDAVIYRLTDSLVSRDKKNALRILDELLRMREVPHRLIFSISLKMRHLLTARIFAEAGLNIAAVKKACGIQHDFQAEFLFRTAKKATLPQCRDAVLLCSATAMELNSAPDPEARITELVIKLALKK